MKNFLLGSVLLGLAASLKTSSLFGRRDSPVGLTVHAPDRIKKGDYEVVDIEI